jgi:hypothetical protein
MKREPDEKQYKRKEASIVNSLKYLSRLESSLLEVIYGGAGATKAAPRQKSGSENIMRLEYDHHFKSTGRARFHTDHTNLCLGVVQITTGESSEIFCSCLVGSRDPVNKRMRKGSLNTARCIMLRNVVVWVTLYIDLR